MAEDDGGEFVPVVCEVMGGIHDEATALFKRILHADHDQGKPWNAGEGFVLLVQRFSVAIQVGNARIFDRVAQLNRVAGLQAPSKRHRIAIPRAQPAARPFKSHQIRIEIPARAPLVSGFGHVKVDPAALDHIRNSDDESVSALLEREQSDLESQSEPDDAEHYAEYCAGEIEVINTDHSADDDTASAADTEIDSDSGEVIGFPGEDAIRGDRRVILGQQRGGSRRR